MNKMRNRSLAAARLRAAPVAVRLGREAERLLGQLAEAAAYALADPIEPEMLILRGGGAGVSLGCGRFAAASGEVLERAGLAEREGAAAAARVE